MKPVHVVVALLSVIRHFVKLDGKQSALWEEFVALLESL